MSYFAMQTHTSQYKEIDREMDLVISTRQKAFCIFKTARVEKSLSVFICSGSAFRNHHITPVLLLPPLLLPKDATWHGRVGTPTTHISLIKTFAALHFHRAAFAPLCGACAKKEVLMGNENFKEALGCCSEMFNA